MPISYNAGDCIEADGVDLDFRRFQPQRPRRNTRLNTLVFHFLLQIDAKAIITKEISPKRFQIEQRSMLNSGDGIHGELISAFSTEHIKKPVVGHRTGRHKGQFLSIRSFTFAKLDRAWKALERKEINV
jgi:hypothetical protein